MTPEQLQQLQEVLKESVKEQVKITVNGKIDKLTENLQTTNEKLDDHIKRMEPVVKNYEGRNWFFGQIAYWSLPISSIVGMIYMWLNSKAK